MIHTLKNEVLNISIDTKGAELRNVQDINSGFEFMWQADPSVWGRTAPVLFPIVGKLKEDSISIDGKKYHMSQHGFARDLEFYVSDQGPEHIVFALKSTEEIKHFYPYEFLLFIAYQLKGNKLICSYEVVNTGAEEMHFSIGAHPGFNLIESKMEQYELEFERMETAPRWLLDSGLFTGQTEAILDEAKILRLDKKLFYKDAIVFKNLQSSSIMLRHKQLAHSIKMEFDGFSYFGIWSKKDSEDFICLEPWCGLADNIQGNSDISMKEGIHHLKPNESFMKSYTITFTI